MSTPIIDDLQDQLAAAKDLIREAWRIVEIFHGPEGWKEYQHSPEVKRKNAFLNPKEGK